MDPEKSSKSTLDLLKLNLEKDMLKDESDDNEMDMKPMALGWKILRQRLH